MQQSKFFYGWWIAIASAIGVGCNFSLLVNATTGIFAGPMGSAQNWTRDAIILATLFASVPSPLISPFVGALVDRFGARQMILWSYLLQVLLLLSFYFMGDNVWGLYLRYGLLAVLCMGTTNVTFAKLIALWFFKRRGLALGIVLAGVGAGGAVWSLLTQQLIDQFGWRLAYAVMAAIIGVLILPLLMLLVRNTPASMGLTVDGLPPSAETAKASDEKNGYTLSQTSCLPHYWVLIFSLLLIGTAIQAIQVNMVPMMTSRGETAQTAVKIQSLLWIAIVFGRVSTGWLMDRFFAPRVAMCYMAAPLIGLLLLATQPGIGFAIVAAICMGLAAGAEIDVIAYLVSRYFGLHQYSRIYGTFYGTYGIAAFIGPYAAAYISTHWAGGYSPVLWLCVGSLCIGTLLMLALPRFPQALPMQAKSPEAA